MLLEPDSESLTVSGRACGPRVAELPEEDHRRVYYYSIFPNLLLSLHPRLHHVPHALARGAGSHAGSSASGSSTRGRFHLNGARPENAVKFWDTTGTARTGTSASSASRACRREATLRAPIRPARAYRPPGIAST